MIKDYDFITTYSKSHNIDMKYIKQLTFLVTEDCNLRCSYCYELHKDKDSVMTKESSIKIIDWLFDNTLINEENTKFILLDFIGGEPFLEIDLINFIVDYFIEKTIITNKWINNFMISITTNGTLVLTDKVKEFIEKNKNRLSVSVTIDGNKDLHDSCRIYENGKGSFSDAIQSAKYLRDKYNIKNSKLTISPNNINYIYDAVLYLKSELDLDYIYINTVFEKGWDKSHNILFYNQLMKLADYLLKDKMYEKFGLSIIFDLLDISNDIDINFCGTTKANMYTFDNDGNIFTCLRFMKHSLANKEPVIIGNIFDNTINYDNIEKLSKLTINTQALDKCRDCKLISICPTCTAHNYDNSESIDNVLKTDYDCDLQKIRYLASYYLYKKVGYDVEQFFNDEEIYELIGDNLYEYKARLS